MKIWKLLLGSCLFLATLPLAGGFARAEEPWRYRATAYVDRAAVDEGDDEPGSVLKLQPRYGGGLFATRTYDLQDERDLGLLFGISTERYPENADQNRLFFDANADYIVPLQMGKLRQLRFGLDLRHAHGDDNWVYNRARFETAVRFQPAKRNTLQLRARLGYRDQNDVDTFPGYDQAEYLVDAQHNWRSEGGLWRTTSIVYYEHREADLDFYTYNEAGIRLIGRHELTDVATLVGRTNAFVRDYADDLREDHRFRGTVGIDWDLGNEIVLESYVGYQRNESTLPEKDYGGGVFGIAISKVF
ncbi:MAG TPA: hypothetical protein VIZ90_06155 [Rhizobiaceae bacterium]